MASLQEEVDDVIKDVVRPNWRRGQEGYMPMVELFTVTCEHRKGRLGHIYGYSSGNKNLRVILFYFRRDAVPLRLFNAHHRSPTLPGETMEAHRSIPHHNQRVPSTPHPHTSFFN